MRHIVLFFVTFSFALFSHCASAVALSDLSLNCKVTDVKDLKDRADVQFTIRTGETKELYRDANRAYSVSLADSHLGANFRVMSLRVSDRTTGASQASTTHFEKFPPQVELVTQNPWVVFACFEF
jgi:hypothetical protein